MRMLALLSLGMLAMTMSVTAAEKESKDAPKAPVIDAEVLARVPDADPATELPNPFLEAVRGQHPRLLFTKDDIARMKKTIESPLGKDFMEKLEGYVQACNPPKEQHPKFLTDATDAQRQGLWRMPTAALHYLLTGNAKSLARAKGYMQLLLDQPHWEAGRELDCGMGAANIMIGAALCYDWLYDELDADFREKYRQKLILQARRMYHLGHMTKSKAVHYWQSDPQNNHRHHRLAGLTLCALAACEGKPEEAWILKKTVDELKFIHEWLAADGSYHDSPSYMAFGVQYVVMAFEASDRCTGTEYMGHGFFKENAFFRLQTLVPGLKTTFAYGDGSGTGGYNNYLFRCTAKHRQPDLQAGLEEMYRVHPRSMEFTWWSIIYYDPEMKGGDLGKIAKHAYFPDMGLVYVRDGWRATDTGMLFKCGPYGGYDLNRFRNERDFHYINVAHDHPDANSFQLYTRGGLIATDDNYPHAKTTAPHNTILVNGKGQRGESKGWLQPIKGVDMTTLANIVTFKASDEVVLTEGEAGGAYPDLTRYRRAVIWAKGRYVLVVDDIRAKAEADLTWMLHSPAMDAADAANGRYTIGKGDALTEMQVLASPKGSAAISEDKHENKRKPYTRGQKLHLDAKTATWRVTAVFDLWKKGGLTVASEALDGETVTLTIKGGDFEDTLTWTPAAENDKPATFKLAGTQIFSADAADKVTLPKH